MLANITQVVNEASRQTLVVDKQDTLIIYSDEAMFLSEDGRKQLMEAMNCKKMVILGTNDSIQIIKGT